MIESLEQYKRDHVKSLVSLHRKLEPKTDAAIWIRRQEPEVWLVEVVPDMPDDDKVDQPMVYPPTTDFPFCLVLIAGNLKSLEAAIRRDRKLAAVIADGEVQTGRRGVGSHLLHLAKDVVGAATR